MFQFAGFPSVRYGFAHGYMRSSHVGFPIQIPADLWVFAPPRSFSQLVASFFGSQCQGIRPAPFLLDLSSFGLFRYSVTVSAFARSPVLSSFPVLLSLLIFLCVDFSRCILPLKHLSFSLSALELRNPPASLVPPYLKWRRRDSNS